MPESNLFASRVRDHANVRSQTNKKEPIRRISYNTDARETSMSKSDEPNATLHQNLGAKPYVSLSSTTSA